MFNQFVRRAGGLALAAFALILGSSNVRAESNQTFYEEQGNLVRGSQGVAALGSDLFGDQVDLYTGALTFKQTDVSLPGNSALPVSITRTRLAGRPGSLTGQFGDWDLEIPHLSGNFSTKYGWVGTNNSTSRCTNFGQPWAVIIGNQSWWPFIYWSGNSLHAPGADGEEILTRSSANTTAPTDGNNYPLVTRGNWQIRCLGTLANGVGEGFLAVSPDGTQYRFDWMASRYLRPMVKGKYAMPRGEYWILPTQIRDRFGNTVTYTWNAASPWQLTKVEASDGRRLTMTYADATRISSVSDGTRTWNYTYNGNLTAVALPDGSQWTFSLATMNARNILQLGANGTCYSPGDYPTGNFPGTMTHPSGAVGTFNTAFVEHNRLQTPYSCEPLDDRPAGTEDYPTYAVHPGSWVTQAIQSKVISGPGVPTQTWTYYWNYGESNDPSCCSGSKNVYVTDPANAVSRYTYGATFNVNEGQQLRVEEGWSSSAGAVRTTTMRYHGPTGPNPIGSSDVQAVDPMSLRNLPMDKREVLLQGTTFTWQVNDFDYFSRAIDVTKTGPGGSRGEVTTYFDQLALWVLGQIDKVSSGGFAMVDNDYFTSNANLASKREFGVLKENNTYNSDGTLASRADGANNIIYYSNYKRGLPQTVSYPTGASESAVVNDIGLIASVTGPAGYTTNYGFDANGRLASITPPAGWMGTSLAFEKVNSAEYGLPAGHWRQTISRGAARDIRYFDAYWRPVMQRTFDSADEANTRKVVVAGFDAAGRKSYQSYPQRDVGDVGNRPSGRYMNYDQVGRLILTQADSELGQLNATVEYLSGFQTRITNPRGKANTQTFWALDAPDKALLSGMTAPAGVNLSISRDGFGKPLAITRAGSFNGYSNSVTRQYVYDESQRLCKSIEPEIGASIQIYDFAGNISWRASGQNLISTASCDQESVPVTAKITYGYDALNRLTTVSYGDGSPAITRDYTPDGLLQSVNSNGSSWTYGYNSLRKLSTENLIFAGQSWNLSWAYNTSGNISALTFPNNSTVTYSPNALGEAQAISGYAGGISYHPNGAVAGYTLANGIVHALTQNTRGFPLVIRDTGVIQDQYSYDASGNVTAIGDQQEGVFSRSMGYDDLDRLISADAPSVWGNATYAYDPVDNLRLAVVGSRSSIFNFDTNNQLGSAVTNGAATSYSYDVRGNLSGKGQQTFGFDLGNRLSWSSLGGSYFYDGLGRRFRVVSSDGSTRVQVYGQYGQLLWGTSTGGPRPNSSTAYIYLAGKQIAETTNGTTQYVHTDALGSPVAHTGATAALSNRTRFEPYGYVAAGTKPSAGTSIIGFSGHVQDAETDLVYMQQRYYDPIVGRFLSVDPIVADGNTGKSFGRYHYAENNPYRFVDPSGLISTDDAPTGSHIRPQKPDDGPDKAIKLLAIAIGMTLNALSDTLNDAVNAVKQALTSAGAGDKRGADTAGTPGGGGGCGDLHHLCTDKNEKSESKGGPWTPRFKEMFDKADMTLNDSENIVRVEGHYGPHPQEYHEYVYKYLQARTEGAVGPEYGQALRAGLRELGKEASTPGTRLNGLLTKPKP